MSLVHVAKLFRAVGLRPCGPAQWREPISERRPGVYVVALVGDCNDGCGRTNVAYLSPAEHDRWLVDQPVIYIGRTTRPLAQRLREFYRHRYGDRSPHRGGQAVLLLQCKLWVYWAPTNRLKEVERNMIAVFHDRTGALPFANRRG